MERRQLVKVYVFIRETDEVEDVWDPNEQSLTLSLSLNDATQGWFTDICGYQLQIDS